MSRRKVFLTRNDNGYLVKASKKNAPLNSFHCMLIGFCVRVWSVEAAQKDEDILEGLLSLYSSEFGRSTSLFSSTIPERLR